VGARAGEQAGWVRLMLSYHFEVQKNFKSTINVSSSPSPNPQLHTPTRNKNFTLITPKEDRETLRDQLSAAPAAGDPADVAMSAARCTAA